MTPPTADKQVADPKRRSRSRAPKLFPLTSFEDALLLPTKILEHGVDGQIKRLTLLDKIGKSPSSSKTRAWIIGSSKYGLISGSYKSSSLTVTGEGRAILTPGSSVEKTRKMFGLAVGRFDPFMKVYGKLKDQRLPDETVLQDELGHAGVDEVDCQRAATIFAANIRYLRLVRQVKDADYVVSIEEAVEHLSPAYSVPEEVRAANGESPAADSYAPPSRATVEGAATAGAPSLHVDVQIHIDATASAEQIDQIFSSMAKHLYGRNE